MMQGRTGRACASTARATSRQSRSWNSIKPESFGGWISGLAFDQFDGGTLAYTTGGTVYRTADALKPELLWKPWVKGVEETVPMDLISPTGGAHLISGIGDVHGFVHERFDAPPAKWLVNPDLPHTDNLDWAGRAPNVLVRNCARLFSRSGRRIARLVGGRRAQLARTDCAAGEGRHGRAGSHRRRREGADQRLGERQDLRHLRLGIARHGRPRPQLVETEGVPAGVTALADKGDPHVWYAID